MRAFALVAALVTMLGIAAEPIPGGGGFAQILSRVGLEPGDLEVGAAPDWLGHPATSTVPFVLPHVERVQRDPRRLVALGRNLLHAARHHRGQKEPGSLQGLFTVLALQPRLPGFRGLPVPIRELPEAEGALTAMLARLRDTAEGEDLAPVDHQAPLLVPPLPPPGDAEVTLPRPLRLPIARLLGALWQAGRAVERSWRHVPPSTLERALRTSEVPRLLAGGSVWWPALADAARDGDDVERAHAALLALAGIDRAVAEIGDLDPDDLDGFDRWQADVPWGRIVVAGKGAHRHRCDEDCLLIVDLGGDDLYLGSAAAATATRQPVSVVIDLAGNDRYQAAGGAAQGAGLGGIGVLFDLDGDDVYEAGDAAQGFGFLGYGVLRDAAGSDRFVAAGGAQGSAVFGGGLLVSEGEDRDEYRILGEGQGFGGPDACGVLVDLGGDDTYFAEPNPEIARGRADYHSGGRVAASNAQGAGVGRRGDQSDGQVWAGGVGALIDLGGDDRYTAGNFAQGIGYWYGTGMLLDAAGDDVYRSVYFSQASGAHFSLALLWDLAGNDRHLLEQEAAASLGYGWDFALSVFVDGGGDDLYRAEDTALAAAELSSVALFLELGGDDEYRLPARARALGTVRENRRAWSPDGPLQSAAVAAAVGLFVDLGGEDRYPDVIGPCRSAPADLELWTCSEGNARPAAVHLGAGIDADRPPPPEIIEWLGLAPAVPPASG